MILIENAHFELIKKFNKKIRVYTLIADSL